MADAYAARQLAAIGAAGGLAAFALFQVISKRQQEAMAQLGSGAHNHSSTRAAREQSAKIGQLIDDLKTKSTREKLEGAFDGAVRTHSIGFPQQK